MTSGSRAQAAAFTRRCFLLGLICQPESAMMMSLYGCGEYPFGFGCGERGAIIMGCRAGHFSPWQGKKTADLRLRS